jgi:hypothetical protein
MLSKAKHLRLFPKARLLQNTIRDGKPGLAPKAFGAALQLRFSQNDTPEMVLAEFQDAPADR